VKRKEFDEFHSLFLDVQDMVRGKTTWDQKRWDMYIARIQIVWPALYNQHHDLVNSIGKALEKSR
jgi:hypothetical protein